MISISKVVTVCLYYTSTFARDGGTKYVGGRAQGSFRFPWEFPPIYSYYTHTPALHFSTFPSAVVCFYVTKLPVTALHLFSFLLFILLGPLS
ncbi:hypothetical protein BU24DRAFT_416132 [Aaosphaeria arxii CBS 175.79]|uniref:Uncharacterized protein n=1 Tax=Aaosphaeria arxii CBS 175.79 TaxID=1450172 RepID=A0A6A5Y4E0_9PLEO|nr:uncharacterized protein BU24DRAFT_416132 [Aaosphaeria arxii CBS 175.79]KAF2020445.1 hypothetical protein BU24DRAFT_416132 [Aaosphaeria arxii CBS 175.79]